MTLPTDRDAGKLSRNDALNRYELMLDGNVIGVADYVEQPDGVALTHTEITPEFRRRGHSSRLAKFAVEDIIAAGHRVKPYCSYMEAYLRKHPEYSHHVYWPQDR